MFENLTKQRLHAKIFNRFFSWRIFSTCCCSTKRCFSTKRVVSTRRVCLICCFTKRRFVAKKTSSCCFAIQIFFVWRVFSICCCSIRFACFFVRRVFSCVFAMRICSVRVFSMFAFMTSLLNEQFEHALTCALIKSEYNHWLTNSRKWQYLQSIIRKFVRLFSFMYNSTFFICDTIDRTCDQLSIKKIFRYFEIVNMMYDCLNMKNCEKFVNRYFDAQWLEYSDCQIECSKTKRCNATKIVIVKFDWIFHESCNNYRLLN